MTLKFDEWPSKAIGHLFILHQALCIISNPWVKSNLSYSPETPNLGQNCRFLSHVTLKFDGRPRKITRHFFYTTLSFVHHFKAMGELKLELKSESAPLLSNTNLGASFHRHMRFQTGVTVRKRLNGAMTSVTFTFHRWHWPFAPTSRLSMVITTENFRMIR